MSEYASISLNNQDSEYAEVPKYDKILNTKNSEYDRVLNMRALHSILNVSKHALAEF